MDSTNETPQRGKMRIEELRAMLASEHEAAMGAMQASKLTTDRADALDYYFGDMTKDMPVEDGRSSAVSFDVADTIEGLMPSMMEIFAGSDEVVQFDPVGPEDVEAARQETDYVNHVFMNENPGFMVLYSFIKDALLSKVGFVKVFWDQREKEEKETYYDQSDDAYALICADPDVEVVAHSERPDPSGMIPGMEQAPPGAEKQPMLHDVTVVRKKDYSSAAVVNVPPEECGLERGARTLKDCNYFFHKVLKAEQRLIEQGYDPQQVRALPVYRAYTNMEEVNRDSVDEHQFYDSDVNPAVKQKQVIEHYVRMDYEGDGVSRLYRVTTSGLTGEILNLDGKPDIQECDEIPFAAMCPIPVTHRFWGRSIADVTLDIQKVKTAITRGTLDNMYLALKPRVEVAESLSSDSTLDDLLVARPGGIIRTKQPGAVNWQVVPNIAESAFPVLEYYDTLREWRTGVSRQGQGIDADALQNQSATAANLAYTASQARMKLIARIFAETGIRDLFYLLHGTIRKHGQKARTVRLRNQWVPVDPRNWKTRNDMTVHVGTGSGGRAQRLTELSMITASQEKALTAGLTNLVTPNNLYESAKELVRAVGFKDVDKFFSNPANSPPPQQHPDPKIMEMQMQAQLQQQKQQIDAAHQRAKMEADAALEQQRFEHQRQLEAMKLQMDDAKRQHDDRMAEMDLAMQQQKHQMDMAAKQLTMEHQKTEHTLKTGGVVPDEIMPKVHEHLNGIAQNLAQHSEQLHHALHKAITAPKRVVRDPKTNRVIGVETIQ